MPCWPLGQWAISLSGLRGRGACRFLCRHIAAVFCSAEIQRQCGHKRACDGEVWQTCCGCLSEVITGACSRAARCARPMLLARADEETKLAVRWRCIQVKLPHKGITDRKVLDPLLMLKVL